MGTIRARLPRKVPCSHPPNNIAIVFSHHSTEIFVILTRQSSDTAKHHNIFNTGVKHRNGTDCKSGKVCIINKIERSCYSWNVRIR
ncbi:TPA: hypothetical protein I7693_22790 [Vibrio vulnificus]|nr:hypothetical protein [Vibrio vulnificus]HAS6076382.1 hypothetical protein [Vibrio vulnificus]HAS6078891.1 hypothetical protein [Vibrio vulnificus]HAS6140687.1 hypothetical protein [Vibrio vulnificus]HAS6166233.1 hypothetical protein [Vibrio vulnificus]